MDVRKLSLAGAVCLPTIADSLQIFSMPLAEFYEVHCTKKGWTFCEPFQKLFCILIEYAKVSVTRSHCAMNTKANVKWRFTACLLALCNDTGNESYIGTVDNPIRNAYRSGVKVKRVSKPLKGPK